MAAVQQQQPQTNDVHGDDVNNWIERAKHTLNKPDHITKPATAAQGARPWNTGFFDCFNPIESCMSSPNLIPLASNTSLLLSRPRDLLLSLCHLRQDSPSSPQIPNP
jgi:hypothetical protein